MITATLLREVPAHLLVGVNSGELQVYGSIIRSLSDGRIIGHLQETSGLASLAGKALSGGVPGLGSVVNIAGHTVSFAQNEQIKAAVNVVQNLQLANLALSAASIGVSVAGFAVLAAKIGKVEAKIDALGERLDAIAGGIEFLKRDQIAEDFTRLRTTTQQLDEGWQLRNPVPQWQRVADESHHLSNQFERRAAEVLDNDPDPVAVEPFLEALALATSARVQARLASGEDQAGRTAAESGAMALIRVGDRLRAARTAIARAQKAQAIAGTPEWASALDEASSTIRVSAETIKARESTAVGAALTLEELQRQGISGREWLETARAEVSAPLLFLQAAAEA